jgi:hypothetical protein
MVPSVDDSFIRANSSTVGNGWTASNGSFQISNNTLIVNASAGYASTQLYRPLATETCQDQCIILDWTTPAGGTANASTPQVVAEARSFSGNFYMAFLNPSGIGGLPQVNLYTVVSGTTTQIGGTFNLSSYTLGHSFEMNLTVTGVSPTTLRVTVFDTTTNTQIGTLTTTDSTSALQNASGVMAIGGNLAFPLTITRARCINLANSIAVTDANLFWTGNWYTQSAGSKQSVRSGAYVKGSWSGTAANILFDTSPLDTAGAAIGQYPLVTFSIDNGPYATPFQLLPYQSALAMVNSLSAGTHTFEFMFLALGALDQYTTPVNTVRITGFTADGASQALTTLRPNRMRYCGDSIGEGTRSLGIGFNVFDKDPRYAPPFALAWALNAEVTNDSVGSQGWTIAGQNNVPAFQTSWSKFDSGDSRLSGGVDVYPQDYVVICQGQNDYGSNVSDATVATSVAATLTSIRTANPSSVILVLIPISGGARTGINNGFTTYQAATPDKKCTIVDAGTAAQLGLTAKSPQASGSLQSADQLHPLGFIVARWAAQIAWNAFTDPGTSKVLASAPPYTYAGVSKQGTAASGGGTTGTTASIDAHLI